MARLGSKSVGLVVVSGESHQGLIGQNLLEFGFGVIKVGFCLQAEGKDRFSVIEFSGGEFADDSACVLLELSNCDENL